MLRKGDGGLYKAPTKEERRKRTAKWRERDQMQFIDLRIERWQVARFRKARIRQEKLHVLGTNDDLWDGVRGLGRNLLWGGNSFHCKKSRSPALVSVDIGTDVVQTTGKKAAQLMDNVKQIC